MSSDESRPASPAQDHPSRRFPLSAWVGAGLPLALVWVVLLVTDAVPTGVLTAIGVAIVVLVLWIGTSATVRMRRGR